MVNKIRGFRISYIGKGEWAIKHIVMSFTDRDRKDTTAGLWDGQWSVLITLTLACVRTGDCAGALSCSLIPDAKDTGPIAKSGQRLSFTLDGPGVMMPSGAE